MYAIGVEIVLLDLGEFLFFDEGGEEGVQQEEGMRKGTARREQQKD